MREIKIKFNKITFTVYLEKEKKIISYGIKRNKEYLMHSFTPKSKADEVKMDIYKNLSDAIAHEIRHEIEKL